MSQRAMLVLGCLGVGLVGFFGISGSDVWWHVRAGEWFLENGFDSSEPFAFTSERWRYSEVLAQLVMAGAYKIAADGGLVLLQALLLGVMAAVMARVCRIGEEPKPEGPAVVVALALLGASVLPVAELKPQLFAYVVFAVFIGLLRTAEEGRFQRLWWTPVLMMIWANVHRSGTLAVGLAAAVSLTWVVVHRRRRAGRALGTVTMVSLLALLLNTGGFFYLSSTFDVVSREAFRQFDPEWQPLSWSVVLHQHAPLLLMAALWLADRVRRRRFDAELVVTLILGVMTARSARLLPFLAIAMAPAVARIVHIGLRRVPQVYSEVGSLAFLSALLAITYLGHFPPAQRVASTVSSQVPVALVDFLEASPPPGVAWNDLDLGGYLLYRLGPEHQVSLDGRTDTVYEEGFFENAMLAAYEEDRFAALAERYEIDVVIATYRERDEAFAFLHRDPEWDLVYWDDLAFVLVRRTPESASYLHRHGYRTLRVHNGQARAEHLSEDPERDALMRDILRNVEDSPDSMRALYFAALVYAQSDEETYLTIRDDIERLAAERGLTPPGLP